MTSELPPEIKAYMQSYPPHVRDLLEKVRAAIRDVVPEAQEALRYAIPTFILQGNLVHYGAFKNHIGFYPGASGMEHFKERLSAWSCSKGAVQFPFEQPIPYDLIAEITAFRVQENLAKAEAKKQKRKTGPG